MAIEVLQADITRLDVDAIVNAANTSLLGGGGVDGAIHRAAGPQLLAACRVLNGCETGEAKITPGFNLPARWVIHTVGPVWHGGVRQEAQLLFNAYDNSFQLALTNGIKSIAFPCISTGVYRFPKTEAARIAIKAMQQYQDKFSRIIACVFNGEDLALYQKLLAEL